MITVSQAAAIFHVESAVVIFLVSLLLLYTALLIAREKKTIERMKMGREHLVGLLDSESSLSPGDVEPLGRLPLYLQIRLLSEVTPNLKGEGRQRLALVGSALGLADHAWTLGRSRQWRKRLRAVRVLSLVDVDPSRMMEFLQDPQPLIREEALDWLADHPSVRTVEALLPFLDDPAPIVRFCAEDGLSRAGRILVDPLLHYLTSCQCGHLEKALRLATSCPDPRFLPQALQHARAEDRDVRASAICLLGAIGGEQAIQILDEALADSALKVRAQAAAALGILHHWRSAARVSLLLADDSWQVRRIAAQSLRVMGPPGLLYLRRASRTDGPGRDIAQHVLGLPEALARVEAPR